MDFDTAFQILTDSQHEGGYVNDPKDPGGETKYGISKRSYPGEDIKNLTLERAKQLYARDFWGPAGCDLAPDKLKYELFDFAVNTSQPGRPVTAIKAMQRAAGVVDDGVIGPATSLAVSTAQPDWLTRRFFSQVIRYYTGLRPDLKVQYLSGWMNRLAVNLERIA